VSDTVLYTLRNNVKDAQEGVAPINLWFDNEKAANPYLSRYSESCWVDEMHTTTAFKKLVCITTVVEHIVRESENVSKGTEWEEKWSF
jgi:hypothetical protein